MWSHSTCSHFKSKILKSLLNTKLPKVTRIKKQFQNQPSNAISVERLLSKVKPRSIVYLQKPENTCMNIVHTLVFQARVVWRARCWLESLHKATWLYLQHQNMWAQWPQVIVQQFGATSLLGDQEPVPYSANHKAEAISYGVDLSILKLISNPSHPEPIWAAFIQGLAQILPPSYYKIISM